MTLHWKNLMGISRFIGIVCRKQAEAEYQSAKQAREMQQKLEEEKRKAEETQRKKIEELKVRQCKVKKI